MLVVDFVMDRVKQVIFESIDTALSRFDFVDKRLLYDKLVRDCSVNPEDISEKYDLFHTILAEMYGVKHFQIEREIVKVLHERSESGEYKEAHEIPAFGIIVESYFKETVESSQRFREKLRENRARIQNIKQKQKRIEESANEKKRQRMHA